MFRRRRNLSRFTSRQRSRRRRASSNTRRGRWRVCTENRRRVSSFGFQRPLYENSRLWRVREDVCALHHFSSEPAGLRPNVRDIYRSRLAPGKYQEPENLGDAINTEFDEFEQYIAPDESFLIFMAGGRLSDSVRGSVLYLFTN